MHTCQQVQQPHAEVPRVHGAIGRLVLRRVGHIHQGQDGGVAEVDEAVHTTRGVDGGVPPPRASRGGGGTMGRPHTALDLQRRSVGTIKKSLKNAKQYHTKQQNKQ